MACNVSSVTAVLRYFSHVIVYPAHGRKGICCMLLHADRRELLLQGVLGEAGEEAQSSRPEIGQVLREIFFTLHFYLFKKTYYVWLDALGSVEELQDGPDPRRVVFNGGGRELCELAVRCEDLEILRLNKIINFFVKNYLPPKNFSGQVCSSCWAGHGEEQGQQSWPGRLPRHLRESPLALS